MKSKSSMASSKRPQSLRVQFDPRQAARRGAWSAVVTALAVLLTAINVFPPAKVFYQSKAKLIVARGGVDKLLEQLRADRQTPGNGGQDAMLTSVRVLDQVEAGSVLPSENQEMVLVETVSVWRKHCDVPTQRQWLESITKVEDSDIEQSQFARNHRFAQWELQVAKHYRDSHIFLADKKSISVSENGRGLYLAKAVQRPQTKLAAYATVKPQFVDRAETRQGLEAEVRRTEAQVQANMVAWRQSAAAIPDLQLASLPKVTAVSSRVPRTAVLFLLLAGVFTASIGGWIQHRVYVGGLFASSLVAAKLEHQGLPKLGDLAIVTHEKKNQMWLDRTEDAVVSLTATFAKHLVRASETTIGIWLVFISVRLLLDPTWRTLLSESPLSALGRSLVGLP